ncbi:MAG: histidine kinase [Spirochaetes bacterium GWF1_31_7]|nr:MAG: histidine kinase [Spirochaetes bacterium GWE1_32_154]OHD48781.1 MAG: histidine kinase [Spirochaetes bacterium GWE2_31_10]OHD52844.1 MAG: histidine kinase [Spirochaetes bacterium GWF1_31_7]HBD95177.1 response regulator [Spirochaetia bacterium]HBI37541.1 response regulator [Spirochaetia bacterium]
MKIFIVDDSTVGREVIKKALGVYGYNDIEEAKDGVDALEQIELKKPLVDLFVLDINMPRMDGLTLLGKIRTIYKTTPVVMLTTETDKAKMVKAKESGATGWIIKPFDAEKLVKVIEMVVPKK